MKILICPDSFKGSLKAEQASELISVALLALDNKLRTHNLPLGDGGEGTGRLLAAHFNASEIQCEARDPLGRSLSTSYYMTSDSIAIIEMASASGWELLLESERNPLKTSTEGTGDLIGHAARQGAKNILLTVGGSATNDGGAGMAEALGAVFLDETGDRIIPSGGNLFRIRGIEIQNITELPPIELFHDVMNPLLGPEGATYTYGLQKGAGELELPLLEDGLKNLADVLEEKFSLDFREVPGMGAAGGIGLCATALFGAAISSGSARVSKLLDLEGHISVSDVVITGEGRLDEQSLRGKVVGHVLGTARKYGKPVIVICGSNQLAKIPAGLHVITLQELAGPGEDPVTSASSLIAKAARSAYELFPSL